MSSAVTPAGHEEKAVNDWTIMVFFAGEENISPAMISQLKAIKDAGFEKSTSVLIHYDPNKKGVGTVTFDINRLRKAELGTSIGDGKNPYVRNLIEDIVEGPPKSATAQDALKMFLDMGLQPEYLAKHYAVVLVGHGMVVGNDAFLPDDSPETAITLKELGTILLDFKRAVDAKDKGGVVELIGLHSCSMSAIEVVYELKGAGRYLMATEGSSFVGSWPYRQLMKKILHAIDDAKEKKYDVDIDQLIMSVQRLALHNSTDFMFAGISADLCLCSLNPEKVYDLNPALRKLTKALKAGVKDQHALELIKLAHLKSQSYWQETYTDLFDFCLCLEGECKSSDPIQKAILDACQLVKEKLKESNRPDGFIIHADYFGPLYQYSHGLSVYFPWAPPVQEVPALPGDDILQRYSKYNFTQDLKTGSEDHSWLSFLNLYFEKTQRDTRAEEDNIKVEAEFYPAHVVTLLGSASINGGESLDEESRKTTSQLQKTTSQLFDGGCGCSVKNYPMQFLRSVRAAEDPNEKSNGSSGRRPARVPATK